MARRTVAADEKPALTELRGHAVEPSTASNPVLAGDPKDPHGSMRRPPGLPEGSPVVPLGYLGKISFFLSADHTLETIHAEKYTLNNIFWLYRGQQDYVQSTWPRYGAKGAITGVEGHDCYCDHIVSISRAGPWDPSYRMRGAGAWIETDGTLILHCGTTLFCKRIDGVAYERPPGIFADYVYAKTEAQPRPWPDPVPAAGMTKLLKGLKSWNWVRPDLDPMLLLGWLGCAILTGALKWRPMVWVTGERETGKSEVHRVIDALLGNSLIHTTNTTAAGLYRKVGLSSLPIAVDELEASDDNRKATAVIEIARQSSSGGVTLRAAPEHGSMEFTSRSPFLLSSILIPPMLPQDISRMAVLGLNEWQGAEHGLTDDEMDDLGRKLRRRMFDAWPKWHQRLDLWEAGLKRLGHSQRTRDQFGTLLAAADAILNDRLPHADNIDEDLKAWDMASLRERADNAPDYKRMIEHLTTLPLDHVRRAGGQANAARLLEEYFKPADASSLHSVESVKENALRDLMSVGLKPVFVDDVWWLAIANGHQGLARVFDGSHWAGKSGTAGVWVQAARRVPGARWDEQRVRFNGVQARATLVPLAEIIMPSTQDDL